ncbi:unnamed protein product [Lactuca virosa]|uniref:Uncharacterized protein n=1 Tax=Lactuca virosa TaxID=75947 RepID=A0AAU9PTX9_9ASTR|nr:unnamed protein product [Lactuca virosa]
MELFLFDDLLVDNEEDGEVVELKKCSHPFFSNISFISRPHIADDNDKGDDDNSKALVYQYCDQNHKYDTLVSIIAVDYSYTHLI